MFQFTQPGWAATGCISLLLDCIEGFNSRSPDGLRHRLLRRQMGGHKVSIHAARMGCDDGAKWVKTDVKAFQFTQPGWAATLDDRYNIGKTYVSIHAARMGCDPLDQIGAHTIGQFQFTQPGWAATIKTQLWQKNTTVSIHAARMGCDKRTKTPKKK
ncbi:Uncharacterised protein [Porphyromonas cangingivalis]|nr:Uncharacterised protein [Porphyromonas cangingivalis]